MIMDYFIMKTEELILSSFWWDPGQVLRVSF
jgi:hypothetical protein